MTYDELLAVVSHPLAESYNGFNHALRAIAELHKPDLSGAYPVCTECQAIYPCSTIQAIEKEVM